MRVRSSHLAGRFYKIDGWSRLKLEPYLLKGKLSDSQSTWGDDETSAYLILEVGGALDMRRLLHDGLITEVDRYYNGRHRETDLEYLESLNW